MSGDGKGNEVKGIEEKWKKYWEREKIYSFDSKGKKKIYSIDTPPPNVSGAMHMGHAFSYSQQDFIARYKRMRGFNVFYPFGTDDNGLPTEKLIQSLKKVNSKDMAREEFIKLCLKTLKEILPELIQDWKNLAISCDYNIYYSTIDNYSRKISQKSFIELYKKGLIYKKEFPAIWDSVFQTSVAQAELEDKEKETLFSTLFALGSGLLYFFGWASSSKKMLFFSATHLRDSMNDIFSCSIKNVIPSPDLPHPKHL